MAEENESVVSLRFLQYPFILQGHLEFCSHIYYVGIYKIEIKLRFTTN